MSFETFRLIKRNREDSKRVIPGLESEAVKANHSENSGKVASSDIYEKVLADSIQRGNFKLSERLRKDFSGRSNTEGSGMEDPRVKDAVSSAYTKTIISNDSVARKYIEENFSYKRPMAIDRDPVDVLKIMLKNLDKNSYVVEETKRFLEDNAPELLEDERVTIKVKEAMISAHKNGDLETARLLKENFLD